MKLSENNRLWPYLGVVWCLFVLSLMAPRSWRRVAVDTNRPTARSTAARQLSPKRTSVAGWSRQRSKALLEAHPNRHMHAESDVSGTNPEETKRPPSHRIARSRATTFDTIRVAADAPKAVSSTKRGAEIEAVETSLTFASEPAVAQAVRVSNSDERLAMRPSLAVELQRSDMPILKPKTTGGNRKKCSRYLVSPPEELLARLDRLAASAETASWAVRTAERLRSIADPTGAGAHGAFGSPTGFGLPEGDPRRSSLQSKEQKVATELAALKEDVEQASQVAEELSQGDLRTDLLRAQYALRRREEVWNAAFRVEQVTKADGTTAASSDHNEKGQRSRHQELAKRIAAVEKLIGDGAPGQSWRNYLMLEELKALATEDNSFDKDFNRQLVRKVLGRIDAARRYDAQREFVRNGPIAHLETELRHWVAEPVDLSAMLERIESYESAPRSNSARRLALDCQQLAWSADEDMNKVARSLERHYRNANLRIALSNKLANRFLPKPTTVQRDVDDSILGASVLGVSNTSTRLSLRMIPDSRHIRFGLEAKGVVDSDTASSSGPATFHNEGTTWFSADKEFKLAPDGELHESRAVASANGNSELFDLETDFDDIPLVRSLVRRIAVSQHEKSHELALEEVEGRVAYAAQERLNKEAKKAFDRLQGKFEDRILAPARRLGLEPEVVSLQTTDQRVVARLRLAGEHQLGAHTPRPRAPSDSYLSIQLHESAVNNALEQLGLDGEKYRLPDLYRTVVARFRGTEDLDSIEVPEDIPNSESITFADENAAQAAFEEGRLHVTLAISQVRLRRQRYGPLKVHAFYMPETTGAQASLVRNDIVQIETDLPLKVGAQIVLRGMFSKLFSRSRPLPVLPEKLAQDPRMQGLTVNQFLLEDGWLGVAVGPERRMAQRTTGSRQAGANDE